MLIILFILLLCLSAIFSGSETAFLTHQKAKSLVWYRKQKKNSNRLYYYLRNPDQFLITILVGNNLINTAYSTVGTLIFISFFPENIVVIVLAILILIFGEIFPKIYFNQNSDNSILFITKIITIAGIVLKPLIIFSSFVTNIFIRKKNIDQPTQELFTAHDIDTILEESKGKGNFAELKHEYITKVLSLNETRIKEIMIPRVDMVAIDVNETVEHLYEQFAEGGYSKVPAFKGSHDNVIGIIFIYDMLKHRYKTVREYIKPVMMVPDTKRAIDLLIDFRKENKSVAIVLDEYGGTAGLVTIESLLEVLIGEFDIDFNKSRKLERIIALDENRFRVSGRVKIDDLIERGFDLPEGNYETIAGLLLDSLGRFPAKNEFIEIDHYLIKPVYITKKRIVWVELVKNNN